MYTYFLRDVTFFRFALPTMIHYRSYEGIYDRRVQCDTQLSIISRYKRGKYVVWTYRENLESLNKVVYANLVSLRTWTKKVQHRCIVLTVYIHSGVRKTENFKMTSHPCEEMYFRVFPLKSKTKVHAIVGRGTKIINVWN